MASSVPTEPRRVHLQVDTTAKRNLLVLLITGWCATAHRPHIHASIMLPDDGITEPTPVSVTAPLDPWRWWVLATYTCTAALQAATWTVPGIIPNTLAVVNGVSDGANQLLNNYAPLCYLVFAVPSAYLIDRHGVRLSTACGVYLMLASNFLRCLANDRSTVSLVCVHVSFILNGCAGPICSSMASKLALEWFAPSERTTATAISALGNTTGTVLVYLAVPYMVGNDTAATPFAQAAIGQLTLNAALTVLCFINVVMFWIHFPARPWHPPSRSSAAAQAMEGDISFRSIGRDCHRLLSTPAYMLVFVSYASIIGLSNDATALLEKNLAPLTADSQSVAGWVGVGIALGGLGLGLLLAMGIDGFKARKGLLKNVLSICVLCAGVVFLGFCMTVSGTCAQPGCGFSGVSRSPLCACVCAWIESVPLPSLNVSRTDRRHTQHRSEYGHRQLCAERHAERRHHPAHVRCRCRAKLWRGTRGRGHHGAQHWHQCHSSGWVLHARRLVF